MYKENLKNLIMDYLFILESNRGIVTCKRENIAFKILYTIYVKNFTLGYVAVDDYYNPTYNFIYDEKFL